MGSPDETGDVPADGADDGNVASVTVRGTSGGIDEAVEVPAVIHRTADLVAVFGSHWRAGYRGDEVVESLVAPRADDAMQLGSRHEAIEAARRARAGRLAAEAEAAIRMLGYWRSRVQIAKARLGIGADPARLLREVGRLRETISLAERGVGGWMPEVRPLPREMRGPVLLARGREIWRIRATWPLDEGVRVERVAIREVEVYPYADHSTGFDVSFRYVAGEGRDAFRFSHDTADESLSEIRTGYVNQWAFLTPEAAEACVAAQASKLRAAADAAERAMSAVTGGATP